MSDPAVDAAERAMALELSQGAGWTDNEFGATAAREALAPIRKLHDDIWDLSHRNGFSESHQDGMRYVLHELSKLIFTSEELNQ